MLLSVQKLIYDMHGHTPVELLISRIMAPGVGTWRALYNFLIYPEMFCQSIDLSLIAVCKRFEVYATIPVFHKLTKDKFGLVGCAANHVIHLFSIHILNYHSGPLLDPLQSYKFQIIICLQPVLSNCFTIFYQPDMRNVQKSLVK